MYAMIMRQLCNRLMTVTKVTLAMCKNENLHAREGCLHFVTSHEEPVTCDLQIRPTTSQNM